MASYRTDFFLARNCIRNSHFFHFDRHKDFPQHNSEVIGIYRTHHKASVADTRPAAECCRTQETMAHSLVQGF